MFFHYPRLFEFIKSVLLLEPGSPQYLSDTKMPLALFLIEQNWKILVPGLFYIKEIIKIQHGNMSLSLRRALLLMLLMIVQAQWQAFGHLIEMMIKVAYNSFFTNKLLNSEMDLLVGGKYGLWLNEKRLYYRQFPSQIAKERH